jgi:hypothetical protein
MESLLLLNIKHKELVSSNNNLILIKNLKLEDKNYLSMNKKEKKNKKAPLKNEKNLK